MRVRYYEGSGVAVLFLQKGVLNISKLLEKKGSSVVTLRDALFIMMQFQSVPYLVLEQLVLFRLESYRCRKFVILDVLSVEEDQLISHLLEGLGEHFLVAVGELLEADDICV